MRVHFASMAIMSMVAATAALADANVGDAAPAFEAKQWYNLPSGVKSLLPEHLKGKLVMVEFWATW